MSISKYTIVMFYWWLCYPNAPCRMPPSKHQPMGNFLLQLQRTFSWNAITVVVPSTWSQRFWSGRWEHFQLAYYFVRFKSFKGILLLKINILPLFTLFQTHMQVFFYGAEFFFLLLLLFTFCFYYLFYYCWYLYFVYFISKLQTTV